MLGVDKPSLHGAIRKYILYTVIIEAGPFRNNRVVLVMKQAGSQGLEIKAEYMRNLGILKLVVVNHNRTSLFLEQVKIHYSNPLMYIIVLLVVVLVLVVASMLQEAEGVIAFINSMLTLAAIFIGLLGRRIGTKEKKLNVRVVLGPGEPYSLTIPLKKKPVSLEIITNKGSYKTSVRIPQVKPRVAYKSSTSSARK